MRPLPTPPKVPPPTPLEYPRTPFLEVQRFGRGWIWVISLALAVLPGTIIVRLLRRGVPLASRAVLLMVLVLAIVALPPLAMLMINMNVAVTSSEIVIRYFPVRRRIRFSEIASFNPIPYDWGSFGGWGIKWQPRRRRMAYSVSGGRAVELTLASGKRVVIGTQRPDELSAALEAAGVRRAEE